MSASGTLALDWDQEETDVLTMDAPSPLARVASGDVRAVRDCIEEYGGLVWSLARRMLRDEAECEDAVQDAFVALWTSADRFDPDRASDRGFVAMITRRRLIDRIRKKGRRPDTIGFPEGFEVPTDEHRRTEARAESGHVLDALETLPEDRRQFIIMSVVHGMSHGQIAEETGVPLGTIKSGIRRGLMALRSELTGEGKEVER